MFHSKYIYFFSLSYSLFNSVTNLVSLFKLTLSSSIFCHCSKFVFEAIVVTPPTPLVEMFARMFHHCMTSAGFRRNISSLPLNSSARISSSALFGISSSSTSSKILDLGGLMDLSGVAFRQNFHSSFWEYRGD